MRIIILSVAVGLLSFSCARKAICECDGDTTSETYQIKYQNGQPHPIDQCQTIEDNSTDNFVCVFRG